MLKVPFSNSALSAVWRLAVWAGIWWHQIRTEEHRPIGILTRDGHAAVPKPLSKDARNALLARSLSGLDAAARRCLRVRDYPFLFTTGGRAKRGVDPIPRFVASRCRAANWISQNVRTTARCDSARAGRFAQTSG